MQNNLQVPLGFLNSAVQKPGWSRPGGGHLNRETDTRSFCHTLRRMRLTLDCAIYNSWLAWRVDFWGLLIKVSRTCLTVSANGPGRPVRFAVHRQPRGWNFLYHSRIVLSVGGSLWYLVRNVRRTVTIDSVLANSKTQNAFLSPVHATFCHDRSWLPPSTETWKYAMAPITQTNLEKYSTYWYAPLCCVYLGRCAAEFWSSGGTYELPCI
jgi:hypothetical protein